MNLKKMTWPLRLYWDLPRKPSDSVDDLKICEEIIEIKILFLSLRCVSSPLNPSCLDMLDRLREKNISVSLTVSPSALNPSILARLSNAKIKTLLVNASTLDEVRAALSLTPPFLPFNKERSEEGLYSTGISFSIGQDNYRQIPEVVSLCVDNRVPHLVFPIQRLAEEKGCFSINKKEREALAKRLSKIDHGRIQITIHDPFLWQVFYPDKDYHEGGCQAANSMLYLSPEDRVYPCPAMPIELGDMRKTTFREIILSGKKRELRTTLLHPPEECAPCDQVGKCLGGCRGRAFVSAGSLLRSDPACR